MCVAMANTYLRTKQPDSLCIPPNEYVIPYSILAFALQLFLDNASRLLLAAIQFFRPAHGLVPLDHRDYKQMKGTQWTHTQSSPTWKRERTFVLETI